MDDRNPVASKEDLINADYIFCRNFDVNKNTISKVFDDKIAGVKGLSYFCIYSLTLFIFA